MKYAPVHSAGGMNISSTYMCMCTSIACPTSCAVSGIHCCSESELWHCSSTVGPRHSQFSVCGKQWSFQWNPSLLE